MLTESANSISKSFIPENCVVENNVHNQPSYDEIFVMDLDIKTPSGTITLSKNNSEHFRSGGSMLGLK